MSKQEKLYLTVGPSKPYPTVHRHTQEAIDLNLFSISHTGEFFITMYKKLNDNLRQLFNIPESHHILFTGSSTESMHTIIASTVEETSAHLITGGFSDKFYKAAKDLGKKPIMLRLEQNDVLNYEDLDLRDVELLCVTENDTSIGLQIPLAGIQKLKEKYPELLVAVDIVSSAPVTEIDYSYIDMAFFSVHKGLGLPAGLGVLIVNDDSIHKARSLQNKGVSIGGHHSLVSLAEKAETHKTPETPNVFNIFLLERVTSDILGEAQGLSNIRSLTSQKAKLIYDYFDRHEKYPPLISGSYRSLTTPVIYTPGEASDIAERLASKGIIVSKGYKPFENDHIRIANFPSHTLEDIQRLLDCLESVL